MKFLKNLFLFLVLLAALTAKANSETTNQWGAAVFGARLSIVLTNDVLAVGSKVLLTCITTNYSTNNVCFIQTESRGMYEVILIDDSGKSIELNDPANVGDSSERMGGVRINESFECPVPLLFDEKIKPGHFQLVAKQKVFLIKNFDRKNAIRGELISNLLDIDVK